MLHKRTMSKRIKEILLKVDGLTSRQVDMVVTAVMSMPDDKIEKVISELEKDPAGILKNIRVPVKRY